MLEIHESHGIHVECPSDWSLDVSEDGPAATIEVQAPSGLAFAWVRADESCPEPALVVDEVLDAMREEYPDLDAMPALETIQGRHATGFDLEFFALDVTNGASVRCFRTPRRTVLIFGQWTDFGEDNLADIVRDVFQSVDEIDE